MSRKDYIIIAEVIKDITMRKAKGQRIVELFADALKKDNPNFKKDIFFKACGLNN